MTQLNAQLTEQFSAVRNFQLEAQLDVFRTLTTRALDNAGQLFALNLKASRQSVEQATGAFKQLLNARDPRDLLALGTATQDQWQQLFSYGREAFGIVTGVPALNWIASPALAPKLSAPQLAASAARIVDHVADAPAQADDKLVDAGAMAKAEAASETAIADDVPPIAANPVAEAFQEIAPLPASAEHPIAAPVYLDAGLQVELPVVDPVDNAPPVQAASVAAPTPKAARAARKGTK